MRRLPIDRDRFRSGAGDYAAYLETPEGRLRFDLAFANLQEFLPLTPSARGLRGLDIGCGTGTMALRLAGQGFHVMMLDSSPQMLDLASSAAREAGLGMSIARNEGDAGQVANLFQDEVFDLIVCHNVLEFVDDPGAVLRGASQLMRESSLLSVMVRTQAGEVMKAAIQAGDLAGAESSLSAEWGRESLYGGTARLFTLDGVNEMLRQASLTPVAVRGIRVLSDYLPSTISRQAEYERIRRLELTLGRRPEFAAVARYAQFLIRRSTTDAEHHS